MLNFVLMKCVRMTWAAHKKQRRSPRSRLARMATARRKMIPGREHTVNRIVGAVLQRLLAYDVLINYPWIDQRVHPSLLQGVPGRVDKFIPLRTTTPK